MSRAKLNPIARAEADLAESQARVKKLEEDNRLLRDQIVETEKSLALARGGDIAKAALDALEEIKRGLDNMTTQEFARGAEADLRALAGRVLRKAGRLP